MAAAWVVASPAGAGPDDGYHITSILCPTPIGQHCQIDGYVDNDPTEPMVKVSAQIPQLACYAWHSDISAACLNDVPAGDTADVSSLDNGNYPGPYYDIMHLFASSAPAGMDRTVLTVRALNAAIAALFFGAVAWLLPWSMRRLLVYVLLGFGLPLVAYFLTSINPSAWAITGVIVTWFALTGLFATEGRADCPAWRRRTLAGLALAATALAAAARTDGATYCFVAVLAVGAAHLPALKPRQWRSHRLAWAAMLVVAVIGVAGSFTGRQAKGLLGLGDTGRGGFHLLAYNLVNLPDLLMGFWTWNLGWYDVPMLPITTMSALAVGVGLLVLGLRRMNWTKTIAAAGVAFLLLAVPLFTLQMAGNIVRENVQPRYLAPLILLLAAVLLSRPRGHGAPRLSGAQTWVTYVFLVAAHTLGLHQLIQRYVSGLSQPALNLNAGVQWWRPGLPSPMVVWALGSLGFAALALLLFVVKRPTRPRPAGLDDRASADIGGEPTSPGDVAAADPRPPTIGGDQASQADMAASPPLG